MEMFNIMSAENGSAGRVRLFLKYFNTRRQNSHTGKLFKMRTPEAHEITIGELMDRYTVILFDAYGVLVHAHGAMPGAATLVAALNRQRKSYYVLTNDAARLPQTAVDFYRSCGLEIEVDRVITAGSLLRPFFRSRELVGCSCFVLGPRDSYRYVEQAGGTIVGTADRDFDILVLADERGFPFLDTIDEVITALYRMIDKGRDPLLLLPNPDDVYPKGGASFGIAAGSVAVMIESALQRRYGHSDNRSFICLGKPHTPIFEEAVLRSGSRDMIMIGDQIETDIAGAVRFGIESAWLPSGVNHRRTLYLTSSVQPTYVLSSIAIT